MIMRFCECNGPRLIKVVKFTEALYGLPGIHQSAWTSMSYRILWSWKPHYVSFNPTRSLRWRQVSIMASEITGNSTVCSAFFRDNKKKKKKQKKKKKKNITAPHYWLSVRGTNGHLWFPIAKDSNSKTVSLTIRQYIWRFCLRFIIMIPYCNNGGKWRGIKTAHRTLRYA